MFLKPQDNRDPAKHVCKSQNSRSTISRCDRHWRSRPQCLPERISLIALRSCGPATRRRTRLSVRATIERCCHWMLFMSAVQYLLLTRVQKAPGRYLVAERRSRAIILGAVRQGRAIILGPYGRAGPLSWGPYGGAGPLSSGPYGGTGPLSSGPYGGTEPLS